MSKIIIGYPYSGALLAYFSEQIDSEHSHTKSMSRSPYYKTLFGKHYKKHIDKALAFTIMYDDIFITPADNPWPDSKLSTDRDFHPELGLRAQWSAYSEFLNSERGLISHYLNDEKILETFNNQFKLPYRCREMIMSTILYEIKLSRENRCPIICSKGRRSIIERLVEIERPATHPRILDHEKVEILQEYMGATGLLLSPSNLSNLIDVKPDSEVRKYAHSFVRMLEQYEKSPTSSHRMEILDLCRNAIEQEKIGKLASGIMSWAGTLFRIFGGLPGSVVSKGGTYATGLYTENAQWYAFAGEIQKAKTKSILVNKIEELQRINKDTD